MGAAGGGREPAAGAGGAGAEPHITGNVIADDTALDLPGGAIYLESDAVVVSNTLDANEGPLASGIAARFGAAPVVSRNIVVNGRVGVGIFADEAAVPVTGCNDVWQNEGGDYFGVVPGPDAFSADPLFCPGEERFIAEGSPCAPGHAPPACGLVGAREVGCTSGGVTLAGPAPVPARTG